MINFNENDVQTDVNLTLKLTFKLTLINVFSIFQQLEHLKNDNQRLRDENGALIRVISKLSK